MLTEWEEREWNEAEAATTTTNRVGLGSELHPRLSEHM